YAWRLFIAPSPFFWPSETSGLAHAGVPHRVGPPLPRPALRRGPVPSWPTAAGWRRGDETTGRLSAPWGGGLAFLSCSWVSSPYVVYLLSKRHRQTARILQ